MASKKTKGKGQQRPVADQLVYVPGKTDLAAYDTSATPGAIGDKAATLEQMPALLARLGALQECLHARATTQGDHRRVLLVLQGMDTSGKGGVIKHVVGGLSPAGCRLASFKSPTREELSHDFLWRIRKKLPLPGELGIFDRSHYEDVLIARVRGLVPRATWSRRYATINRFEERLAADGCTIVKCFLNISSETQKERLLARLDDPAKHWKYNPADVDERKLWPDYQEAYAAALDKCGTETAPWYVIPADRKWYRNYAVTMLLTKAFEALDLEWPPGDFDLATERQRVADS